MHDVCKCNIYIHTWENAIISFPSIGLSICTPHAPLVIIHQVWCRRCHLVMLPPPEDGLDHRLRGHGLLLLLPAVRPRGLLLAQVLPKRCGEQGAREWSAHGQLEVTSQWHEHHHAMCHIYDRQWLGLQRLGWEAGSIRWTKGWRSSRSSPCFQVTPVCMRFRIYNIYVCRCRIYFYLYYFIT